MSRRNKKSSRFTVLGCQLLNSKLKTHPVSPNNLKRELDSPAISFKSLICYAGQNLKFAVPFALFIGLAILLSFKGTAAAAPLTTGADFILMTTGARPD